MIAHDTTAAGLSDRELLERFCRLREEAAFAALVHRHAPLVWTVCRRILPQAHDAEDAFQATFFVLARKARAVRWQDSVGGWLYTVARRLALKARAEAARRRARERAVAPAAPPGLPAAPTHGIGHIVDEEFERLPKAYREPLLLCCLQGKTREEAARELGWTRGQVKAGLERGRSMLRDRLAGRGLAAPAAIAAALLVRYAPRALELAAAKAGPLIAAGDFSQAPAGAMRLARAYLRGGRVAIARRSIAGLLALLALTCGARAAVGSAAARRAFEIEAPGASAPAVSPRPANQRERNLPPLERGSSDRSPDPTRANS